MILGGILSSCLLLCNGCAVLLVGGAAAAGAGTVAYIRGELSATLDAGLDQTWSAAQATLKELEMPVTAQEKDGVSGKLTARASGDKKVIARLKKVSGTTTEVGIRVGTWGDETTSREILDRIKKRL